MWKLGLVAAMLIIGGTVTTGRSDVTAQESSPAGLAGHPLVGSWIVDTDVDMGSDPPELGIFTADGTVFGLGANRWVSGAWEAADDHTGTVTMMGVFDANGGGYVVLRGPHEVDESGNAWTCPCTFTVVSPDGTVLASGSATAHATRLPVETADAVGQTLPGVPVWTPAAPAEATPAA
ncbi:MAG: hypothetical protein R2853_15860 [Thermomicrobiales bacterium]|nr:hypothetical protein [Thermomicrobiales bacterium]